MNRLRHWRADATAILGLFALALLWFAPVLFPSFTGATLLPYDNLYSFAPWRSLQPGLIPHNNLLSDLVLQNAVWKLHIQRTLAAQELPLWNPQIFTGIPFLAAGQASTFYPLSLLFYLLPLEAAYGWFTALQIGLAGANMYSLGRVLGMRRLAAFFSGVVFMFSGFLIVSVVFTMFVAGVVWLPLLLAIIEFVIRKQEEKGNQSFHPIPYIAAGAAVVALVVLAGHPELIYYTLLVAGVYTLMRLLIARRWLATEVAPATRHPPPATRHSPPATRPWSRIFKLATWLLVMVLLGIAAGGVQLLPLLELLPLNFRQGSVSYAQVVEWAWPNRQVVSFFLPNVFGNPSHHHWFDLWSGQWQPATVNALEEPNHTIFWGVKNYVEAGNYLGIITWLLAALAVLRALRVPAYSVFRPMQHVTWFFTALALISLLFAFGTPLYALLFYGLPGWNQLHSPFRWVFPFTVSMAVLGGMGLDWVLGNRDWGFGIGRTEGNTNYPISNIPRFFAALLILAGIAALALISISLFRPDPFIALGQRLVDGSDLAQMAFANGRMFWGYQVLNVIHFGLVALVGGLLIWWLTRQGDQERFTLSPRHLVTLSLIALTALDLYAAHGRFNPASDPALSPLREENRPSVVDFINQRESLDHAELATRHPPPAPLWRFTTFNQPGEKTFNANVGMYYGWHDLRGYDSIIPKQYVELMNRLAPQENELLYNRIAPLYSNVTPETYAILDNPLLDLLNVKYILTEHYIPNPSWQEVYRDEGIGVYENREVQPRAFIVPEARLAAADQQPLLESDLRNLVFIEETPAAANALTPASPQIKEAQISRYTANEVFVDVNLSDRGWLVVSDAWFPGWKAYVRGFGGAENEEAEIPIYRANGALRTIYLPEAGQWTVRFVYTPMSFKLGAYVSFLAAMTLLLLLLYWFWGRYYQPDRTLSEARTVAKNSLAPLVLSLTNKAIDFAYAMLYVRLLGPEGTGKFYFVVAIYGIFEIVSRYGLGTLLTRDVSADKNQSSRYLTNVIALRTLLWLVSLPVLALVIFAYRTAGDSALGAFLGVKQSIGRDEVQALVILAAAMLFANWSDALSSTFAAFEKMEYPAGLASASNLIKVTLGPLALFLGYGFVGLAAISLLVNGLQTFWFYRLLRSTLFKPEWRWEWPLQRWMFANSGALMINHLLATIFWRIDVWLLKPLAGDVSVGIYSLAYKYVDGLNIIPSLFTLAIFPLMSRYAQQERDYLLRAYILSLRLLLLVCLPIAMAITFLAEPLAYVVGGAQFLNIPETLRLFGREWHYLGGSDLALRVIIWSIPIGFVNSITQYVLIAVHQQHYLTRAFILGVVCNVVGNLLLIPGMGYVGAALVTILSEFSLLFPFYYSVRRNVGPVPWLRICLPPALAVAVMGSMIYGLLQSGLNLWLSVAVGLVGYALALLLTGALRGEDMAVVGRALPLGPLRRLLPVGG